jgi:LmbE family N-acetylglucosaminyl deacetylase
VVIEQLHHMVPRQMRRLVGPPLRRVMGRLVPNLDGPGTAEEAWASWSELARLPVLDPRRWSSAAVLAPHPDDEVLGAGGIMAIMAAAGARLRLIAITDGEASHPDADPVTTARLRAAESAAAREVLGVQDAEVIRLGIPDADVARHESELAKVLRELCAEFDVCLAPWERDAHPDHEAAGRAARRACPNVLRYPVWMWHWAKPNDRRVPWRRAYRITLPADVMARKRSAIQVFSSQVADRGSDFGPLLPAAVLAHFTRSQEVLLR